MNFGEKPNVFGSSRRTHAVYITCTVLPGTKCNAQKSVFHHICWNFAGWMCRALAAWKTLCFSSSSCSFVGISEYMWGFVCCSTLEVILSWAFSTRPCVYRADRASGHAGWAPSQAIMYQPSHLRTGSFILLLRIQVVLLNLQLCIFPFWRGSWAGSIPTPALRCWGHSPDALCREKRKWKCWNKHFGTASWLG